MQRDTPPYVIREDPIGVLPQLAAIPIRFRVTSVLDVELRDAGLGGMRLVERAVGEPYEKDYDAIAGEGPARWAERFDVSNWGVLSAVVDERRIGSAVIAWKSPGVWMLSDRADLAVVWDLRVVPEHRGRGVGGALFQRAADWAAERGCRLLKVETQNVNVAACRFYVGRGCRLGGIDRFAYPSLPDEVQLLWYRDLEPR